MKYLSTILDFLFSETIGIIQFALGVIWAMVDASFNGPPTLIHILVFISTSAWLAIALAGGFVCAASDRIPRQ